MVHHSVQIVLWQKSSLKHTNLQSGKTNRTRCGTAHSENPVEYRLKLASPTAIKETVLPKAVGYVTTKSSSRNVALTRKDHLKKSNFPTSKV